MNYIWRNIFLTMSESMLSTPVDFLFALKYDIDYFFRRCMDTKEQ